MIFAFLAPIALVTPAPPDPCAHPHLSPRLLKKSDIELPADAVPNEQYRDVRIVVKLDALGHVRSAAVFKSSGAPKFDAAILKAARTSVYGPEYRHCRAVASGYIYIAEYGEGTPAPIVRH